MIQLRLKEILDEQGITQKILAKRLGISESALSQKLSRNFGVDLLEQIAAALHVHPADLLRAGSTITCPNCGETIELKVEGIK